MSAEVLDFAAARAARRETAARASSPALDRGYVAALNSTVSGGTCWTLLPVSLRAEDGAPVRVRVRSGLAIALKDLPGVIQTLPVREAAFRLGSLDRLCWTAHATLADLNEALLPHLIAVQAAADPSAGEAT